MLESPAMYIYIYTLYIYIYMYTVYTVFMFYDCSNLKFDTELSVNLENIVEIERDLHRIFVERLRMQANITKKNNKS